MWQVSPKALLPIIGFVIKDFTYSERLVNQINPDRLVIVNLTFEA